LKTNQVVVLAYADKKYKCQQSWYKWVLKLETDQPTSGLAEGNECVGCYLTTY